MNDLGHRPHPSRISFDRGCFVLDGHRTLYQVKAGLLAGGSSFHTFDTRAEAERFARGRSIYEVTEPIYRRISWT